MFIFYVYFCVEIYYFIDLKVKKGYYYGKRNITGGEIIGFMIANKILVGTIGTIIGIGSIYYYLSDKNNDYNNYYNTNIPDEYISEQDYILLCNEIRKLIYKDNDNFLGPKILRFVFNAAATYSKYDNRGGCNGFTLKYEPELSMLHNKGLKEIISLLNSIKDDNIYSDKFVNVSYSDLYVLASYIAIKEMGGYDIPFKFGRIDLTKNDCIEGHKRFPEWDGGGSKMLNWVDRMGITDREAFALMGAHSCGKLNDKNCGIDGVWIDDNDSNILTNEYYKQIKYIPYVYERRGCEHYFDPGNPECVLLPIEGVFFYGARAMKLR